MEPWDIAEQLLAATDQESILKELAADDPFWIGASYAIDPFVGMIYKLPIPHEPIRYEGSMTADIFDHVAMMIIKGDLTGDKLGRTVEMLSRACKKDEWLKWYRPILLGHMDLRLPLALYNKYAPRPLAPPSITEPKPYTPAMAKAQNEPRGDFIIQPAYENRCFWLLDSRSTVMEVRGYTVDCTRIREPEIEKALVDIGQNAPLDIVILGFITDAFYVDDLVTREQFAHERGAYPLRQRLEVIEKLGLPAVQRSDVLQNHEVQKFYDELRLIFEQGYRAAIMRFMDDPYPFRIQRDWKLSAKSWTKELGLKK